MLPEGRMLNSPNSLVSFQELDVLGEGLVKDYAKKVHRSNAMCLDIEGFITDYLGLSIAYESIAEEDMSKIGFLADGKSPLEVTRDKVKTSLAEISVPQLVQPEELRINEDRITRRPIRESGNSIQYLSPSL